MAAIDTEQYKFSDLNKLVFVVFVCFITRFSLGAHLDTANNELRIFVNTSTPSFLIPIKSINGEKQNFSYDAKFGSFDFKRKKIRNEYQPQLTYLDSSKVKLQDGDHTIEFTLNEFAELRVISSSSQQVQFAILTQKEEDFCGGGIRFSDTKLNNRSFVNITEENGIGRGDKPISNWTKMLGIEGAEHATYYPLSFFHSNYNRGLYIDSKNLCLLDFNPSSINLHLFGEANTIVLYEEQNQLAIIQAFNTKNGRGTVYPSWANGAILGVQGGTENVTKKYVKVKAQGAEINAVWIQDWVGKKKTNFGSRLNWTWKLDTIQYLSIHKLKADLNVKFLGYINPFFIADCEYAKEGLSKRYLIQNKDSKKGQFDFGGIHGYMLDMFNPDARNWMKAIIKDNLIQNGFDGWMSDFGEWLDAENMLEGKDDHNRYLDLWIQLNQEVVSEYGNELFFFHRSGVNGTAQHTQLSWLGDQTVDYGLNDGLPSVINAMRSSGLSGLPPVHSDVGGYAEIRIPILPKVNRNEELLIDWMRLEAFTPVFRTHEGLSPEHSLQVYSNDSIARKYAFFTKVNRALQPYFDSLIREYKELGTPIFRDPILLGKSSDLAYEVYIGDDILITYSEKDILAKEGFDKFSFGQNKVFVQIRRGSLPNKVLSHLILL
jgi:alpha-glucosidase